MPYSLHFTRPEAIRSATSTTSLWNSQSNDAKFEMGHILSAATGRRFGKYHETCELATPEDWPVVQEVFRTVQVILDAANELLMQVDVIDHAGMHEINVLIESCTPAHPDRRRKNTFNTSIPRANLAVGQACAALQAKAAKSTLDMDALACEVVGKLITHAGRYKTREPFGEFELFTLVEGATYVSKAALWAPPKAQTEPHQSG